MSVIGWFMSGDVNKSTWVSCPVRRAEVREGSVRRPAAAASADAVAAVVVRRRCCPSKENYCAMCFLWWLLLFPRNSLSVRECTVFFFLLGYHQIFELANLFKDFLRVVITKIFRCKII